MLIHIQLPFDEESVTLQNGSRMTAVRLSALKGKKNKNKAIPVTGRGGL
jgi:hypothetical protein